MTSLKLATSEQEGEIFQLVVSREPPYRILGVSGGLLELTGHTEADILQQTFLLFAGESTCADTVASLKNAIQVGLLTAHPSSL